MNLSRSVWPSVNKIYNNGYDPQAPQHFLSFAERGCKLTPVVSFTKQQKHARGGEDGVLALKAESVAGTHHSGLTAGKGRPEAAAGVWGPSCCFQHPNASSGARFARSHWPSTYRASESLHVLLTTGWWAHSGGSRETKHRTRHSRRSAPTPRGPCHLPPRSAAKPCRPGAF